MPVRASTRAIALHFGYSRPWVSRIFNSDAFQARLAERKKDLVDPTLLLSIDERLGALASRSLDILQDKLELLPAAQVKDIAEMSVKALGYGARQQNVNLQQNFVVAMPQKAASDTDWAAAHAGRLAAGKVVESDGAVTDVIARSPDLAELVQRV